MKKEISENDNIKKDNKSGSSPEINIENKLKKLPKSPGVYFFLNKKKEIIYIGKATSLRSRVRSYFAKDILDKRGPIIEKMTEEVDSIDYKKTENAIEALVLESNFIKKFQPKYNTKEKSGKSFVYLIFTKEEFSKILIKREKDILENKFQKNLSGKIKEKTRKVIGPFDSRRNLERSLQVLRKIFPYFSSAKSYGASSNVYEQIGLAPNKNNKNIYKNNIKNIILFFEGKKKRIIKNLEKEMQEAATREEFEKAELYKKKIFALKHISDFNINFSDDDKYFSEKIRIEAYDIAHLQGENHVGVMTVVENGEKNNSEYGKFKIKSFSGIDDNRALREVLERRFAHKKWAYPQIVVVDGGVAQKRTVEKFLRERFGKNWVENNIKIVSCKKNKNHKVVSILGKREVSEKYKKEILLANAEAHRFAITYHKDKRAKDFLKT